MGKLSSGRSWHDYAVHLVGFTLLLLCISQTTGQTFFDGFVSELTISPVCTTLPCVVKLTCSFNLTEATFKSIQVINRGSLRLLYADDRDDSQQFERHDSVIDYKYDLSPEGSTSFSSLTLDLAIQACDTYDHRCKIVNRDYSPSAKVEYVRFKEPKIDIRFMDNDTDTLEYPGSEFSRELEVVYSGLWAEPSVYALEAPRDIKLDEQMAQLKSHSNCTWYGSQRHLVTFYKVGVFDLKFVVNISDQNYVEFKSVNITAGEVVNVPINVASFSWMYAIAILAIILLCIPSVGFFLWCLYPEKCLKIRNKLLCKEIQQDTLDVAPSSDLQTPSFQKILRQIMRETGVIISLKSGMQDEEEQDDNQRNDVMEQAEGAGEEGQDMTGDASNLPLIRDEGGERDSGMEDHDSGEEEEEDQVEEQKESIEPEHPPEEDVQLKDDAKDQNGEAESEKMGEQREDRDTEESEPEVATEAKEEEEEEEEEGGAVGGVSIKPDSVHFRHRDGPKVDSSSLESWEWVPRDDEGEKDKIVGDGEDKKPKMEAPRGRTEDTGVLEKDAHVQGVDADGENLDDEARDRESDTLDTEAGVRQPYPSLQIGMDFDVVHTDDLPPSQELIDREHPRESEDQYRGWGFFRRLFPSATRGASRQRDVESRRASETARLTPRRQPTLVLKGPHANMDRCKEMLHQYMLGGPAFT